MESLQKLKEEGQVFDLVFIDADKGNYINYYNFIMDNGMLEQSGTLMIDNTLWKGEVYSTSDNISPYGKFLKEFNEHVRQDPRVNQVVLPVHDGVSLIHRVEESD
ncbi:unnamed protein product [Allacma fusca]|uniref:Caffeoyl-CoA O-methyltransferase n=1 Tax=Allacma fusca TaxID=39272 RepID=A0A8J2KSY6_9HEXA|nr:unnamed protein product [Allacma fusca]